MWFEVVYLSLVALLFMSKLCCLRMSGLCVCFNIAAVTLEIEQGV